MGQQKYVPVWIKKSFVLVKNKLMKCYLCYWDTPTGNHTHRRDATRHAPQRLTPRRKCHSCQTTRCDATYFLCRIFIEEIHEYTKTLCCFVMLLAFYNKLIHIDFSWWIVTRGILMYIEFLMLNRTFSNAVFLFQNNSRELLNSNCRHGWVSYLNDWIDHRRSMRLWITKNTYIRYIGNV